MKRLIYRVGKFLRTLKYAFQRAVRGFDDTDVWCMSENLRERFIVLLEELERTRHTLFTKPVDDPSIVEGDFTTYAYTDEETSAIINRMIELAKGTDIEALSERGMEFHEASEIAQENLNELMEMLKIHFWSLGD